MSIADKFASEWAPVLSSSRQIFVTIPEAKRLSHFDNEHLLRPITEAEVLYVVKVLSRHKAAGQDRLNNDYYKETSALIVPAMVIIINQILDGADLPPSFLTALIIPLQKKGDSDDAMDYRPIFLQQTSYKGFAKVLAQRVQVSLPQIIGDSQQGFVQANEWPK